MEKNNDRACLFYIVIAIVLVIIYKAVKFFKQPDAIHQIITFFEAMGLCIGSLILDVRLNFVNKAKFVIPTPLWWI